MGTSDPLLRLMLVLLMLMMMMMLGHSQGCRTWKGERGECTNIRECPEVQLLLEMSKQSPAVMSSLRKSICEINNSTIRVCCKSVEIVRRGASVLPSSCGRTILIDKIVGGVDASLFSWPWIALLRGRNARGSSWVCGGVLISSRYVLTAAHCVHSLRSTLQFVRLGEHRLSTNPDCERRVCAPKPQDIPVESIILHDGYLQTPGCRHCHDIALLRLIRPAELHPAHIVPVCLPMNLEKDLNIYNDDFTNTFAWTGGWGTIDARRTTQPDVLQEAFLPVGKWYCNVSSYPDPNMVLCAGGEGPDSCGGDSGGPLVMTNPRTSRNYVIGIVSSGPRVCGAPRTQGIYTSISYYMTWILNNIKQ